MNSDFRGVFTALVTPMHEDREIDWISYEKLIKDQIASGVSGIIPCGTTGESPTLSQKEKETLIEVAVKLAKGSQTVVFAGTGSNDTKKSIEFSKWAESAGVAGVLVVTPYYNKPSQAGLLKHYFSIADSVQCEVMPYNVPGRTGVSMSAETIAELASHPRINTLKEATGNVAFTSEIRKALALKKRSIGVFSGDDATYLPLLSVGAVGCVSVASNLIPAELVTLTKAFFQNDFSKALSLHERFFGLLKDLFIDTNPVPIKYALQKAGKIQSEQLRLPLVTLSPTHKEHLNRLLLDLDLLKGGTR